MAIDAGSPQLISIFQHSVDRYPAHIALICDHVSLTYAALDQQANQFAHYLRAHHIKAGDIVGVLLPRSVNCYIAMLALYKIGAIYVPISEEYPAERINHILEDMNFALLVTSEEHAKHPSIHYPKTLLLPNITQELAQQSANRLPLPESTISDNPTCYVIYTSGSTGKPNGVEVGHSSICHYINVASTTYGIQQKDRIYHGFSLAFDASFEEIWMAFANGATLVVATSKDLRSGLGLIDFLNHHHITVFSTVPTLLSNLKGMVESLRLLILGGEVCTPSIVSPWVRAGLKILNTYGPTEATVVTTVAEYIHDSPVTIGKPLPGYEVVLLNEHLEPVEYGEAGELCISGSGLAKGYINRATITATKFIQNPHDPTKRLYRTGDLAQWDEHGDLMFLGRVDDQVKLRGFRLELNEIETVLMTYPGIKQAVVSVVTQDEPKLVAYYVTESSKKLDIQALKTFLSQSLPAFMLPSIYEALHEFPLLPSGKVNRKQLPLPTSKPQSNPYHAPKTALEMKIAQIISEVLKTKKVSIKDDFFYDLGGHSLTAAAVISQLRKQPECHHLSMLDLYHHRTIEQLAKACDTLSHKTHTAHAPQFQRTSKWSYRLNALGQAWGIISGYALTSWQIFIFLSAYFWVSYRYPLLSLTSIKIFLGLAIAVPLGSLLVVIAAKWLLLGRIKPGKHRLWGWFYLRWWFVMRLEQMLFPMHHFVGTPLMTLYHRLMGAKIGKQCHINTPYLSVHDLITIGDHASVNHDAVLKAYFVEDGWLHLGPITIGSDCFIGVRAVLSIHSGMNAHSVLEDLSMVPSHQILEAHNYYSGSPAQKAPCPETHITQHAAQRSSQPKLRRFVMGGLQCAAILLVELIHYGLYFLPLYWIASMYVHTSLIETIFLTPFAALMYLGLLCSSIIAFKHISLPTQKGYVDRHSLGWLKHWITLKLLELPEILVMADSLYYPLFLRLLGAKLGHDVEMSEVSHLSPDLLTIHDHGFVAAYASIAASKIYHEQVSFAQATIGKESFVGNRGILPQHSHLHDGGLLGCLSIMPTDTEQASLKHATWLGSPSILLPNREASAHHTEPLYNEPNRWMKLSRFFIESLRILIPPTLMLCHFFLLYSLFLSNLSSTQIFLLFPIVEIGIMLSITGLFVFLKWAIIGKYKPDVIPLWHPFIRRKDIVEYTYGYFLHSQIIQLILGTPFMTALLRLLGTKIGRYAYIETGSFEEFDLIHIDDEVEINSNAIIQTHLYEDRIFKMSNLHIRSFCNIGRDSIVLYDTEMEPHSKLGSLSLLMKGETLPAGSIWEGCPAQAVKEE
ncbi:MAG: peptide synthetase [Legionella sp.]|nr:MAG: peptide synthetase [Legionella sp.]